MPVLFPARTGICFFITKFRSALGPTRFLYHRLFYINRNTYFTRTSSENEETKSNIEFLQQHSVFAADGLLEINTALNSAVLSLDEHLSQTNASRVPKFCYQSVYYCCLFRLLVVRKSTVNCSTNCSKRFRFEEMFQSWHIFFK
jgi:hypothetical protein